MMTQSRQPAHLALAVLLIQLAQRAPSVHAKGLVGKLPGNPASCQEEPCNSDPQHVLAALKVMCMFLACVFILPLLLYYLSKMFTKIRGVCCPRDGAAKDKERDLQEDPDDMEQVKQQQQQQQRERTGSQANNNLCGSISVISGGGCDKEQGQFRLDNNHQRQSSESNQNQNGGEHSGQHERPQQMAAGRHQSLQYGANQADGNLHQFARNQAQRESQRRARRQQRNSIARMPGETRGRPTPPPPAQPASENGGADIDEREQAALMEAYTSMQPHRYSMYFGSGGGGASGVDGCAVGVARPAALPNQNLAAIDHDTRRRKSVRGNGNGGAVQPHVARHVARATNPMSSSIKRRKAASGGYKIHPAPDGQCEGINKQPLARADAIDDQQAHYCSPTALSHRQQLLANDQQNNNNNNHHHNHHHQRLRAGRSSPYAGEGGAGEGGVGNFPFECEPDKTNKFLAGHQPRANEASNLEVPSARPEHRHSIDGSILNNMLAGGRPTTPRSTAAGVETMTTTQQQQQQHSPISQWAEQKQLEYQQQQQQRAGALPPTASLFLDTNGHIHNQQQQQKHRSYQGHGANNGTGQFWQASGGQLRPGGAVDARNRRASLNAAALMRSPGERGQFN